MIMRIYRCRVIPGKEAEHREFAFKKAHPSLSKDKGLIAFYAGKPVPGSEDRTRCMVQMWESLEALKAARGENWNEPMKALPDEAREIYDTATVEHFELADMHHAHQDEMVILN
jgi:heme-degrading monooxygenase HmoA